MASPADSSQTGLDIPPLTGNGGGSGRRNRRRQRQNLRRLNESHKEIWGYLVWSATGIVIGVPEIWAAVGGGNVPWPTISGMIGSIEYHSDWVAILIIGLIIWLGYYALLYPTEDPDTFNRTSLGRITRARADPGTVPWYLYFPVAVLGVVLGSWLAHHVEAQDKFRFGQVLYGLIAVFWIVIPSIIAFPKRGREAPFPTLFQTIVNLERRLRPLAIVVAAGLAVLVIHLVLYPWPAIIPDLKDAHDVYSKQRQHVKPPAKPQAPSAYAP